MKSFRKTFALMMALVLIVSDRRCFKESCCIAVGLLAIYMSQQTDFRGNDSR